MGWEGGSTTRSTFNLLRKVKKGIIVNMVYHSKMKEVNSTTPDKVNKGVEERN